MTTELQKLKEVLSNQEFARVVPLVRMEASASHVVLDAWNGVSQWGEPHLLDDDFFAALDPFTIALERIGLSIQALKLSDSNLDGKTLEALANWSGFADVRELDYGGNRISAKALTAVAKRGESLESLSLDFVKVGNSVAKLTGAPRLNRLSLAFAGIDTTALAHLASAELPALSTLTLDGFGQHATWAGYDKKLGDGRLQFCPVDATSLAPILTPDQQSRWTSLTLGHVQIPPAGFRDVSLVSLDALHLIKVKASASALHSVASIEMPQLRTLDCDGGFPFESLDRAPWFPRMEQLRFNGVDFLDDGQLGTLLSKADSLTSLWIERAEAMGETARGIAAAGAPIQEIRLMWNYLRDDDVALVAKGWATTPPAVIGLSGNQLTGSSVALAAAHSNMLTALGFGFTQLEDADVLPILNADMPHLRTLGLSGNRLSDLTASRVLDRQWPGTKLFLDSNCFSRAAAQELKGKLGPQVPNVDRQYDYKLQLAPSLYPDGFRGVKIGGCEVPPPWPASPKPEVEGVSFPADALRWKPVGTRGHGGDHQLVFTTWNASTNAFEAIELDEPITIPDGAKYLQADGPTGAGGVVAAVAGGPLVNVSPGFANAPPTVRLIGACKQEVHAIAYDGARLVVADGDAGSKGARLRYFKYLGADNVWSWHLQDTIEVAFTPGGAFFPQGASLVVFGPEPGEHGTLHICGLLGWSDTVEDGPAFLRELSSVGPNYTFDRGMVVDAAGNHFTVFLDRPVAQKLYDSIKPDQTEAVTKSSAVAPTSTGPRLWTDANDWYESSVWHLELKFVEQPTSEQRVAVTLALRDWVDGTDGLFEAVSTPPVWSGEWAIVGVEERSFMTDTWTVRDAVAELDHLVRRLSRAHSIAEAVFLECTSHGNPQGTQRRPEPSRSGDDACTQRG